MRVLILTAAVTIFIGLLCLLIGSLWSTRVEKNSRSDVVYIPEILDPKNIEILSGKKIFFGHQSVGQNIVDGMNKLLIDESYCDLHFVDESRLLNLKDGMFLHCAIGRNTLPKSKIRAFRKILVEASENQFDLAMMKFCYIDFNENSDYKEIFDIYSGVIEDLKRHHPQTVFVHFTVPIESMPKGFEGVLKHFLKMVVRRPGVVEDNWVRQQYNDLLRSHYFGIDPVFDLAALESTDNEGLATVRVVNGQNVLFMDGEKSEDGGHLNEKAQEDIGRKLLIFLASAADSDGPNALVGTVGG